MVAIRFEIINSKLVFTAINDRFLRLEIICDIIFSIRANPFSGVCSFQFYGICNQYELNLSRGTGKRSVFFLFSVINLHFPEIEASSTEAQTISSPNMNSFQEKIRFSCKKDEILNQSTGAIIEIMKGRSNLYN